MTESELISEEKKKLRQKMSAIRDSIEKTERERQEEKLLGFLMKSDFLENYDNVYLYFSFKSEFPTKGILNLLLDMKKQVLFPRIDICGNKRVMNFYPYIAKMKKGYMGIMEPEGGNAVLTCGLMFVPGLAFDKNGGRLGYGGGFYDSYIKNAGDMEVDIKTVGLCFSEQVIEEVPMMAKDMRVDEVSALITH